MRWMERLGIWLLVGTRTDKRLSESAEFMRRFAAAHDGVLEACALLEADSIMKAERLAAVYMRDVLANHDERDWWADNEEFLAQPWFIRKYGETKDWFRARNDAHCVSPYIIRPDEKEADTCVQLNIKRNASAPEQGLISVVTPKSEALTELLRGMRYVLLRNGDFVRKIWEINGSIEERAVETGVILLEAGYAVQVAEHRLHDRILSGEYEAECPRWVYESQDPCVLYLRYPRDRSLHRYVCMAGGKWNGKHMEISINYTDRLEELARNYGFRFTLEARRRMDAWHVAMDQASIYRRRKQKNQQSETPEDKFKALLTRTIEVPEDLRDEL